MKKLITKRYWLHILLSIVIFYFLEPHIKEMGSLRDLETIIISGLLGTWLGFTFEWLQAKFSGNGYTDFFFKTLDKLTIIPQSHKVEKDNWDAFTTGIGALVGTALSIIL